MRKLIIVLLAASGLFGGLITYGCGQKENSFGQPITESRFTPIGDILADPANFSGKTVKIQGSITDECPAGGWFLLKDHTGVIYVNLHPSYFAIPQIRNRRVSAQGKVRKEGAQIEVVGEGVRLE